MPGMNAVGIKTAAKMSAIAITGLETCSIARPTVTSELPIICPETEMQHLPRRSS
jgi:hypothetical protein